MSMIAATEEHWRIDPRAVNKDLAKRQNAGASFAKNGKMKGPGNQYGHANGLFAGMGPSDLNMSHVQQRGATLAFGQRQLNYLTSQHTSKNHSNQ